MCGVANWESARDFQSHYDSIHAYPGACQKINKEGGKAGRMWLHVSVPAFLPSLLKFFCPVCQATG
jgi:hypothetical protein